MRGRYCLRCGRERREGEFQCPAFLADAPDKRCGCATYGDTVPGSAVVSLALQGAMRGVLAGLLTLPPGDVALVKGPRGVGKTSVVLTGLSKPWVATSEMKPQKVFDYARRLGVEVMGVSTITVDPETGAVDLNIPAEAWEPVDGRPAADVALDSLTGVGRPRDVLAAARGHANATGARVAAVSQTTTDGEARGGSDLEFNADAVVNLEEMGDGGRRATVEKSRSGPEGSRLYRVTLEGEVTLPDYRAFYTVSGIAPHYTLRHFPPVKGARDPFGAFLRHVSKTGKRRDLPERGPVAVAAMDGGQLYPGRWTEPPDGDARRAFALAHGVPYYDVCNGKMYQPDGVSNGNSDRP